MGRAARPGGVLIAIAGAAALFGGVWGFIAAIRPQCARMEGIVIGPDQSMSTRDPHRFRFSCVVSPITTSTLPQPEQEPTHGSKNSTAGAGDDDRQQWERP